MTTANTLATLGNGPAFSAYRSATQSITSATYTKVQLNLEEFDTANCFDSTTNYRFTPNVAGYYQINATLDLEASSGTIFLASIYKNGTSYSRFFDIRVTSTLIASSGSVLLYLNGTTDYIELYAYISGISPTINPTVQLSGSLVRGA